MTSARAGGTSSSPGERRCWWPHWWPGRCRAGWPVPSSRPWRRPGRIASGDLASRVPVRRGDYPEFASLAGSINGMAQSLEDGRARERHLLLSVSHDLRTPLTSIRGFAEAIQDGAIEDSAQAADVIIAESRRLERLVGDLLDLTKLEARQMSIALRPTDVAEVVTHDRRGVPAGRGQERACHCARRCPATTGRPRRRPRARWRPTPTGWPSCWPTCWRTP